MRMQACDVTRIETGFGNVENVVFFNKTLWLATYDSEINIRTLPVILPLRYAIFLSSHEP